MWDHANYANNLMNFNDQNYISIARKRKSHAGCPENVIVGWGEGTDEGNIGKLKATIWSIDSKSCEVQDFPKHDLANKFVLI